MTTDAPQRLVLEPIGVIHTPFADRLSAPRQPHASNDIRATIELFPGRGFEHALEDLDGWDYLWVIFWFHLNEGFRSKVLPPRSEKKRGVFSTRSPHRPNPLGLSLVRLERVEGLRLDVRGADMIDGTPVLDLKPYLPFGESHPQAKTGWLESTGGSACSADAPVDPVPAYAVTWSDAALDRVQYLLRTHAVDLMAPVNQILSLGPQPHPYRRIRKDGSSLVLAHKEWRVRFEIDERQVRVLDVRSGYRPKEIAESTDSAMRVHQDFVERYGY